MTERHECPHCGKATQAVDAKQLAGPDHDPLFTFEGGVRYCFDCQVPFLPRGSSFLSACGVLSKGMPRIPYLDTLAGPDETDEGRVVIGANPEPDWVILTSSWQAATKTEHVDVRIGGRRLDERTGRFVLDLMKMSFGEAIVRRRRRTFDIHFLGYETDSREVWQIEEIRDWCRDLWVTEYDVACYLTEATLAPFAAAACSALDDDWFISALSKASLPFTDGDSIGLRSTSFILLADARWQYRLQSVPRLGFSDSDCEKWMAPWRERSCEHIKSISQMLVSDTARGAETKIGLKEGRKNPGGRAKWWQVWR